MSALEPYKVCQEFLSIKKYGKLLRKFEGELSSSLPRLPQPGELFIVHNDNVKDWKSDQYRWKHTGVKHVKGPKHSKPYLTCHYFTYHHDESYTGPKFQKRAYILYEGGSYYAKKTLVHYVGSLEGVVPLPHGNRKHHLERDHHMTAKSQLEKQKSKLGLPAQKLYKELVTENVSSELAPVLLPRDRKQVSNTVIKERERKQISRDDIYGVYLLSSELDLFVSDLILVPDFMAIMYSKESLDLFSQISHLPDIVFQYDTTFQLGDFFVSTLSYRFKLFDNEPVIPLFILIHDTKTADVHRKFFEMVKSVCGERLNEKIFVTDREAAIVQAISGVLPDNPYFYCWNHIIRDIEYWVVKHKNTDSGDILVYKSHIWNLLDSESENDSLSKLTEMKKQWSDMFCKYYEKHIHDAVIKSGKWKLIPHNIYIQGSGITINAAESFNAVLKRIFDRKEVSMSVLTLCLYQLDLYYQKEIGRGLCNTGNYLFKSEFFHLKKDPAEVKLPAALIPLDRLPYVFENYDMKNVQQVDDTEEKPHTNFSMAKWLVVQNRIRLVPDEHVFIITTDKKKEMVTIYPKESCTCPLKKACHHITAAKLSIGLEEQDHHYVKLTAALKKKRGYKSGRKKPQNIVVVEGAEDAILKDGDNTTFLIPTASKQSKVVKKRFYKPTSEIHDTIGPRTDNETNDPKRPSKRPFITSTPAKRKPDVSDASDTQPQKELLEDLNIDLSDIDDKELDFTFRQKFANNKEFKIYGRVIHPSDLLTVTPYDVDLKRMIHSKHHSINETRSSTDYFMIDSIFDVYLPHLIATYVKGSVTVSAAESFIINHIDFAIMRPFEFGLRYFLTHDVPQKDVVIIPLTKNNHCTLILVFRKQRLILYMDSLSAPIIPVKELEFVLKLMKTYCEIRHLPFSVDEWIISCPVDTPRQKNAHDCGTYCCLFVEFFLSGGKEFISADIYTGNADACMKYRRKLKSQLLKLMKEETSPQDLFAAKFVPQNAILPEPLLSIDTSKIKTSIPGNQGTEEFLRNIILNYWDEDTASACHLGPDCPPSSANTEMILCCRCDHWYHLLCVGVNQVVEHYICKGCQGS